MNTIINVSSTVANEFADLFLSLNMANAGKAAVYIVLGVTAVSVFFMGL